jgi:hypothetical protein
MHKLVRVCNNQDHTKKMATGVSGKMVNKLTMSTINMANGEKIVMSVMNALKALTICLLIADLLCLFDDSSGA